ncbi:MAG: YodL domain-containing protein [Candidatus Faecousia sp.]|nr:YodL domain-containing protein [Candidatus Faecousia sp.]
MSEKQSNKERIKEITAGIEKGIMELFESDRYRNYLTTMSRFHRYSLNNVMLIHAQRPNATLVAGFSKWKNSFGRHVKKGEKGIQILAPTPYKIMVDKEKLDPDTKLPMLDDEGKPITEEKEVTIPMFKVVSVFDVAQTEGKPLPQISFSLTGDVAQYEVFMEALRRTSQVPITIEPMEPGMDGYFHLEKQAIFLREGMSQVQTVCAAIHEMAHSRLHNYEKMTELADDGETLLVPGEKGRNTEEVEAESISYAVCQYFGIETADNSFGYIATWSQGKELKELRASLETINKTSSELISGIEQHYREICKEKGINLDPPDQIPEEHPPEVPPQIVESVLAETEVQQKEHVQEMNAEILPLPDPIITPDMMEWYGYHDPNMFPLSKDRALELLERDALLFMLYPDNTDEMVLGSEDVVNHDGIIGITREEWQDIHDSVPARDVHQRFLDAPGDAYAIMQLKGDVPPELRFASLERLDGAPSPDHYDTIYTGPIVCEQSQMATLERLYEIFNLNRPGDFTGHSLSVSDIVALKQDDVVSYHYCDSIGFKELPDFQKENYLKAAEMSTEDDYGMIDGIINNGKQPTVADLEQQAKSGQPISLMDLADALHREKKPSVLEKLKDQPQQPQRKSKPRKSKEKEI